MLTKSVIILDKSGSMGSAREGTIRGFNELVQQIKIDSKEGKEIKTSLVTFNGSVFEHFWNVDADSLHEIEPADYIPSGSTAMRDALGYVVEKLLSEKEDEQVRFDITVVTDGETNTDTKYRSREALNELLEQCRKAGNWTFSWIGCSEESALRAAKEYHMPVANVGHFTVGSNTGSENLFRGIRERKSAYYGSAVTCSVNMMSDDSSKSADFTLGGLNAAYESPTTTVASTVLEEKKKK